MRIARISAFLGLALFLSLAANLYMGGVMLGSHYSGSQCDSRKAEWEKRDAALRARLSAEDYAIVKEGMKAHRREFKEARARLDAARDAVDAAMKAEIFDQAALDSALMAERDLKAGMMSDMRAAREEVIRKLSPEGQAIMKDVSRSIGAEGRTRAPDDRPPRDTP